MTQPAQPPLSRETMFAGFRRVMVKIGSRTLANDSDVYARLARALSTRKEAVLVSSGAIALGLAALGFSARPREISALAACAAAGQSRLMRRYEEAFEAEGRRVAQVLLTHEDLADRQRANNAREALETLLSASVVPIINENDTVAVDEIKFGDNDQLSAMVSGLLSADLLVLLSDVEGLLDGEGKLVSVVTDVVNEGFPLVGKAPTQAGQVQVGTGGMGSKLEAARKASLAGATVVLADARRPLVLERIFAGEAVGTLILPASNQLTARKHWIAFTLRPKGSVVVDEGAARALRDKGGSLLFVGVLGVTGDFAAGDPVSIVDGQGVELGRGLAAVSLLDAARLCGKRAPDPHRDEPGRKSLEAVHRDDLVLL